MKHSRHIGKKLEWAFREIRSYLSVSHRNTFNKLKDARRLTSDQSTLKLVLFDFQSIAIDNVGGRYLYRIIYDFISLGYTPCYKNNYRFLANMETKGFKKHFLELDHIFYSQESELHEIGELSLLISDSQPSLSQSTSPIKIKVDYTLRAATKNELSLTFGASPVLLRDGFFTESLTLNKPRKNTLFFAGRTRKEEYGRDLLDKNYGMLNRLEILDIASNYPSSNKIIATKQLTKEEWEKPHEIMLISNEYCSIPKENWMDCLADSDFFLACPGSEMPLCHNVIEALAAGSIPILEYSQYIKPGLIDGVHCLRFHGEEELKKALKKALQMSSKEKETMRLHIQEFYQTHYRLGSFALQLLSQTNTTLVMNDYRIKI